MINIAPKTKEYLKMRVKIFCIKAKKSQVVHIAGFSLVPQVTIPAAKEKLGIVKLINNNQTIF